MIADDVCAMRLRKVAEVFGDRASTSLCLRRRPNDQMRLHENSNLTAWFKMKTVVTNDVLFYEPGRRQLQDLPASALARRLTMCALSASVIPNTRDRRWVYTAGLVLVRQKPGSAKGVMFITMEDEISPANIVVCPSLFEKRKRIVLGSSMMAIDGRIQREGEVVHLVA